MPLEELVVVRDDPVVDADDGAVPDRMVVGGEGGVALRVIPHMEERRARGRRDRDEIEQLAGAGALLVDGYGSVSGPVGVPGRIGASFRDRGEQNLGCERPVDAAFDAKAVSGDSAHRLDCRRPRRRHTVGTVPAVRLLY